MWRSQTKTKIHQLTFHWKNGSFFLRMQEYSSAKWGIPHELQAQFVGKEDLLETHLTIYIMYLWHSKTPAGPSSRYRGIASCAVPRSQLCCQPPVFKGMQKDLFLPKQTSHKGSLGTILPFQFTQFPLGPLFVYTRGDMRQHLNTIYMALSNYIYFSSPAWGFPLPWNSHSLPPQPVNLIREGVWVRPIINAQP